MMDRLIEGKKPRKQRGSNRKLNNVNYLDWINPINNRSFGDLAVTHDIEMFQQKMRVTKPHFDEIVEVCFDDLHRAWSGHGNKPFNYALVERKIAIVFRYLASKDSLDTIGACFGVQQLQALKSPSSGRS